MHDPVYSRIKCLARRIWKRPIRTVDDDGYENIKKAIRVFSDPYMMDDEKVEAIAGIKALAPRAYAPTKKLPRVVMTLRAVNR